MKKTLFSITLAVSVLTLTGYSQTNPVARSVAKVKQWATPKEGELFAKGETQLDFAALYSKPQPGGLGELFRNDFKHGPFGANVGLNYFGNRYLGGGVELSVNDFHNPGDLIFNSMGFNVIARLPISHVAPYVLAGVNREFSLGTYSFHAGPGVEFRFTRSLGVFTDARFNWLVNHRDDYASVRAGVRLSF